MFDNIAIPADLDTPAEALAFAVAERRAGDAAEARLLMVAAHWADLHAVLPGQEADGMTSSVRAAGVERLVPLAGKGTPVVAEFACAELAAALSMSTYAGQLLVGDALELRHRMPRLWGRVKTGSLQAWRARQIAQHTKGLSPEAAAFVDREVEPSAHKIGLRRICAVVEAAVKRFDAEAAADGEKRAHRSRGVWLSEEMADGTRSVRIEADALDATAFDQTIEAIAEALARAGDEDGQDVRRAKAVGLIADPRGALDLLTGETATAAATGEAGCSPADGDEATAEQSNAGPAGRRKRRGGKPAVTLYLHLHEDAITSHQGIGRVEGLGSVTEQMIRDWLGRSDVTVKPVLDLADRASVDAYEVPDRMGEVVLLRNPCCPFPWCNNLSRNKDKDHIDPYVPLDRGGPPGQTAAHRLAAPCRRHHRLKTHGGWSYSMPEPGIYLWRSPLGHRYLVDHTGTTALADTG